MRLEVCLLALVVVGVLGAYYGHVIGDAEPGIVASDIVDSLGRIQAPDKRLAEVSRLLRLTARRHRVEMYAFGGVVSALAAVALLDARSLRRRARRQNKKEP
jgi:hypothetical protein